MLAYIHFVILNSHVAAIYLLSKTLSSMQKNRKIKSSYTGFFQARKLLVQ